MKCCLSSCSYIKPQLRRHVADSLAVVYHLVPTSNHNSNSRKINSWMLFIILFLHQTTTKELSLPYSIMLFIILFLHQTTTMKIEKTNYQQLFIILFLHQTTTVITCSYFRTCCLSSCSYIKPQLILWEIKNPVCCLSSCSYIKPQRRRLAATQTLSCLSSCSYIKPQLTDYTQQPTVGCLSSCSYIKPQPAPLACLPATVVYHLVPTSNHNLGSSRVTAATVVYHLVPTSNHNFTRGESDALRLFIILFLHQTTTSAGELLPCYCVVYHLVPTSNHNLWT